MKNELNKVIRSRATLANVEGSETRWLATNLACNTPKESDDFDIQIEADDIVRACVKAQESHRNDDSACRTTSSNIQGYFVPEEFINSTFVIPEANGGQLRDACTVLRVNSKDGYVPTLDSVAMSYLAEEAAYTGAEQTPTVGQVSFGVLKIAGLTRVSDELLADSVPNLPALLTQIFQSANGRFQDKEILAGNGTARYNGIVNGVDGAGSSVTYSTLANATSVIASDIVSAYFNVPQQHRGVENFRWIFPSAISALINGIGATAAGVHAIDSLTNAPDAFLMGRQVLNVDVAGQPFGTTITSTEKIGLAGNMSAYYLFERAGMSIRRNDSLYMGNGQVGFFATARSDGRMATAEAFKILRAA